MKLFLVIDIGGTDLKYGVLDEKINFINKGSTPTKSLEGGLAIISQIKDIYENYIKTYDLQGIAISSAGIINTDSTEVLFATDAIRNYIGVNFREEIAKFTNLPVSIDNDVNCVGLSEHKFGIAKNHKNVISLTIGTGIGGSIILDNKMFHGNNFSAGNWGSMIIEGAHFEKHSSTKALVDKSKEIDPTIKNGVDVFNLYDNNNESINTLVREFYRILGIGISNLILSFNPEIVVIGGGITNRGQLFLKELDLEIKKNLSDYIYENVQIELAEFKNDAGMVGAYINFLNTFNL